MNIRTGDSVYCGATSETHSGVAVFAFGSTISPGNGYVLGCKQVTSISSKTIYDNGIAESYSFTNISSPGGSGNWTGTGVGSTFTVTNGATKYITLTWHPATVYYRLTVTGAGSGSGTVTSNPAGINYPSDSIQDYNSGTNVNLTASPNAGSTFANWSGACSGTGSCSVSMSSNKTVTATFNAAVVNNIVQVGSSNPGSGVYIAGSQSGTSGTTAYDINMAGNISTTLYPDPVPSGKDFNYWSGCDSTSGTGCTVSVSGGGTKTVAVYFKNEPTPPPPAQTINLTADSPTLGTPGAGYNVRFQSRIKETDGSRTADSFQVRWSITSPSSSWEYYIGGITAWGAVSTHQDANLSPGTYQVCIEVDTSNRIYERDESQADNRKCASLKVGSTPTPIPIGPITLSGTSYCDDTIGSLVDLSWSATTGDTSFRIYKDGINIGNGTSYLIRKETGNEWHDWHVQGTSSGIQSNTLQLFTVWCAPTPTPAPTPPPVPPGTVSGFKWAETPISGPFKSSGGVPPGGIVRLYNSAGAIKGTSAQTSDTFSFSAAPGNYWMRATAVSGWTIYYCIDGSGCSAPSAVGATIDTNTFYVPSNGTVGVYFYYNKPVAATPTPTPTPPSTPPPTPTPAPPDLDLNDIILSEFKFYEDDARSINKSIFNPGDSFWGRVKVVNNGGSAAGAFDIGVYLERGSQPACSDSADFTKNVGSLAVGAVNTFDFNGTLPAVGGDKTSYAYADNNCVLAAETDKSDNISSLTYNVNVISWFETYGGDVGAGNMGVGNIGNITLKADSPPGTTKFTQNKYNR